MALQLANVHLCPNLISGTAFMHRSPTDNDEELLSMAVKWAHRGRC